VIQVEPGDKVRAILNVLNFKDPDYVNNHYIVMVTQKGVIKKTTLEAFSRPRQAGLIAININEDDRLLDVKLTDGNSDIIIAKRSGKAVRFAESQVRPMGRTATGVRGVTLESEDDVVVGVVAIKEGEVEKTLLVISENGYGKRSALADYPVINRGGKGVKTLNVTDKTGALVGILDVEESDNLMIINKSGISIRMGLESLRIVGRNTQGVRLLRINDGDAISSVAIVKSDALDEESKDQIPPVVDVPQDGTSNDVNPSENEPIIGGEE
jgi:DNA gyrase subunit A